MKRKFGETSNIYDQYYDHSYSDNEFVLVNNILKEYDDMKEEIKRLQQFIKDFNLFIKPFYHMA